MYSFLYFNFSFLDVFLGVQEFWRFFEFRFRYLFLCFVLKILVIFVFMCFEVVVEIVDLQWVERRVGSVLNQEVNGELGSINGVEKNLRDLQVDIV